MVSTWPSNYFDSIITDPPYELGFMGKSWDSSGIAYSVPLWKQLLRVSKPGAFLLCFGGTRTHHRVVCAIEDAGWEIRDCMMWLYGSGFPKSHNISKAIDKAAGAERSFKCKNPADRPYNYTKGETSTGWKSPIRPDKTNPATDLAKIWDGYGTALKPAWEPIIVAMKPLDGTFAHNAETHQVAGLNINGGRIGTESITQHGRKESQSQSMSGKNYEQKSGTNEHQGRWPANLILDAEVATMLDEQTGELKGPWGKESKQHVGKDGETSMFGCGGVNSQNIIRGKESGGASRFFYCAKASKKERNLGCEDLPEKISGGMQGTVDQTLLTGSGNIRNNKAKNNHPTVKPLAIIKYLCTLLKMPNPNQVILDPFMGSGTTGMACKSLGINFIGIDLSLDYCHIARKRIDATPAEEK